MFKRIVVFTGLILVIFSSQITATVDLNLEHTFTLPMAGEIDFNDLENDGSCEVLIVHDSSIVLYSPLLDQTLFSTTIDSAYTYYIDKSLFEDVNHDLIPDILILLIFNYYNPVYYKVIMYDGASNFQNMATVMHTAPLSFGLIYQQLRTFDVMDWNNDGYNNLIISLDSITEISGSDSMKISGYTFTYFSFPDSIINTKYDTMSLSNILEIPASFNLGTFAATRHLGTWTGDIGEPPFYENKGTII